jgi:hypothetical protein
MGCRASGGRLLGIGAHTTDQPVQLIIDEAGIAKKGSASHQLQHAG